MSTWEIWIAQRKVANDGSRYSRTAGTIYLVRSRSKHFMENFEEISMFMLQKCNGFIKYNSVCNSYFCKCETASFSWEKKPDDIFIECSVVIMTQPFEMCWILHGSLHFWCGKLDAIYRFPCKTFPKLKALNKIFGVLLAPYTIDFRPLLVLHVSESIYSIWFVCLRSGWKLCDQFKLMIFVCRLFFFSFFFHTSFCNKIVRSFKTLFTFNHSHFSLEYLSYVQNHFVKSWKYIK